MPAKGSMETWVPEGLRKPFLFLVSGGATFLVDLGTVYLLIYLLKLDPFFARFFSILLAMLCGYVINRQFVFGRSGKKVSVEMVQYLSVAIFNAVLSYLIYAGLIGFVDGFNPLLATAIAVMIVAVSSYAGYSRLVFKTRKTAA